MKSILSVLAALLFVSASAFAQTCGGAVGWPQMAPVATGSIAVRTAPCGFTGATVGQGLLLSGGTLSALVASVAGRTGAVVLTHNDLTDWASSTAGFANKAANLSDLPVPLTARANLGISGTRKTNRFTMAWVGGVNPSQNTWSGLTPVTLMGAVPLETTAYAIRVGWCNPFSYDITINSVSAYPSSNYSAAGTVDANGIATVAPQGGAPGSKLYFAAKGADSSQINDGSLGTTRSFVVKGSNTTLPNSNCVLQWTDWAPFTTIARDDGGTQPLAFIYVTIGGTGSIDYSMSNSGGVFSAGGNTQGRRIMFAAAWTRGTDYADNPSGTSWAQGGGGSQSSPFYAVQYLSHNTGDQILITGDSWSVSPTNDSITSPIWRAAMARSTPTNPIGVANLAWGANAFGAYGPFAQMNLMAIRPTIYVPQGISRNDGMTTAMLQELFGKHLALYDWMRTAFGSRIIWNLPGAAQFVDGNSVQIAAWTDARTRLLSIGALPDVGYIDCPSLIAQSNTYDYLVGYSDDGVHPNVTAAAACKPLADAALAKVLN